MSDFYDDRSAIAGSSYGGGPGAPVLLLHSLAMDRTMWSPTLLTLFGTGRQLITCDLPGHGESELGESRSIEAIADRVALMLTGLGVGRVGVVGVSMGGCVAQALAIRHGTQVRGLGLVDTTSDYGDLDAWTTRAATARREGFPAMADFQGTRWFTPAFREQQPAELARLLKIFERMDIDDYEVICHAMGTVSLTDRLGEIAVPTAVAVGEDDYATPVSHAEIIASRIPGATLAVFEHASHLGIIERPKDIFGTVERVL